MTDAAAWLYVAVHLTWWPMGAGAELGPVLQIERPGGFAELAPCTVEVTWSGEEAAEFSVASSLRAWVRP